MRRVQPKERGTTWRSMMVGQISASSAIRNNCSADQLGAVGGFGDPSLRKEIVDVEVTITDADVPPVEGRSASCNNWQQTSSNTSCIRCP